MANYFFYKENYPWSAVCSVVNNDGEIIFSFASRNSKNPSLSTTNAFVGELTDYRGKKVGTYSAYCCLVSLDDSAYSGTTDDNGTISNGVIGNAVVVSNPLSPQEDFTGYYRGEQKKKFTMPQEYVISGGTVFTDVSVTDAGNYTINDDTEYYTGVRLRYTNGRYSCSDDGVFVGKDNENVVTESVSAGNLRLVFERSYTAVDRDFYYVVRSVDDTGMESTVSEISPLASIHPDEKVLLSLSVDESLISEEHLKSLRLYRSAGGTNDSDFLFCQEIEITGETSSDGKRHFTFDDHLAEDELNEPMPAFGQVPENLQGIVGMSGGFMAGYKNKDLYFSEPYLPNTWCWNYSQSVPFDIVGLAVRGNYLYVFTEGPLYAFVGDSPDTLVPLAMRFDVPCISKKSIAYVRGSIIYAGTTGLVIINSSGPQIFSDALFTIEQYKAVGFENCIGSGEYDGKYFAVFVDRVLLFDFSDGDGVKLTTLDSGCFTASTYRHDDGSYPVEKLRNTPYGETLITQEFENSSPALAAWRSKEFVFARPIAFSCGRICFSDSTSPVTLILYAEGREVCRIDNVVSSRAFRLPVLRRECHWSVEVQGSTDITSVELAESMSEL